MNVHSGKGQTKTRDNPGWELDCPDRVVALVHETIANTTT
jgi:hypothetical protein